MGQAQFNRVGGADQHHDGASTLFSAKAHCRIAANQVQPTHTIGSMPPHSNSDPSLTVDTRSCVLCLQILIPLKERERERKRKKVESGRQRSISHLDLALVFF